MGLFAEQLSQGAFISAIIGVSIGYLAETVFFCFYGNKLFKKGVNVD